MTKPTPTAIEKNINKFLKKSEEEHKSYLSSQSSDGAKYQLKDINHPLDDEVRPFLVNFKEEIAPQNLTHTQETWIKLIEKSIQCLRFYDSREPFIKNPEKKPQAYGKDDLKIIFNHLLTLKRCFMELTLTTETTSFTLFMFGRQV